MPSTQGGRIENIKNDYGITVKNMMGGDTFLCKIWAPVVFLHILLRIIKKDLNNKRTKSAHKKN